MISGRVPRMVATRSRALLIQAGSQMVSGFPESLFSLDQKRVYSISGFVILCIVGVKERNVDRFGALSRDRALDDPVGALHRPPEQHDSPAKL